MSRIPQTDGTDKKLGRYSSIWYRGVRLTQFLGGTLGPTAAGAAEGG